MSTVYDESTMTLQREAAASDQTGTLQPVIAAHLPEPPHASPLRHTDVEYAVSTLRLMAAACRDGSYRTYAGIAYDLEMLAGELDTPDVPPMLARLMTKVQR
jgi:hypothetical protein